MTILPGVGVNGSSILILLDCCDDNFARCKWVLDPDPDPCYRSSMTLLPGVMGARGPERFTAHSIADILAREGSTRSR